MLPDRCARTGLEVLAACREGLDRGRGQPRYVIGGDDWGPVEIGPGLITLIGGAPGVGKTALAMQWTVEALRFDPTLRAVVANVETSPEPLMMRQMARLSGVDAARLRAGSLDQEELDRLEAARPTLEEAAGRLRFLERPVTLESLGRVAMASDSALLVVDYIQRFGAVGRDGVDQSMQMLRQFAMGGAAVIVVSALARGSGGGFYPESLSAYRDSSELEYGADSAMLLTARRRGGHRLRILKNRHGECGELDLAFEGARQQFEVVKAPAPRMNEEDRHELN